MLLSIWRIDTRWLRAVGAIRKGGATREGGVSVKDAILATQPTSNWPLDDLGGPSSCHDEMRLHDASLPLAGVTLRARLNAH